MKNILIVLSLALCSTAVSAANVSWKIQGVINAGASGTLLDQIWGGGAISQNDTFEILLTFNDTSPGTPSGNDGVNYQSAIQSLQLRINGHSAYLTVGGSGWPNDGKADEREISLFNDGTEVVDGYIQDSFNIVNVDRMESRYAPGANRHEYLSLVFTDRRLLAEGANMLSSTDLTSVAPGDPLKANYSKQMYFGVTDTAVGGVQVRGTVTSISAIPIPAAVWLFGSALAGLGWIRRKQSS